MKYRKKPVVIEAEQYKPGMEDGFNCYEILGKYIGYYPKDGPLPRSKRVPAIYTLEGPHEITMGDWIITGVKGERYPIKADIFEMTYEPVEEE
jgi:hypothetical protein